MGGDQAEVVVRKPGEQIQKCGGVRPAGERDDQSVARPEEPLPADGLFDAG